jgi:hypothetical protein
MSASVPAGDGGLPYAALVQAQVPRLLSQIDREPASPTYGCADREWWAWKFRDVPLGMMQTVAYPLALLWADRDLGGPLAGDPRILSWAVAAMEFACRRQHRDGSFDAFAPHEHDIGPTLGVAHGIAETLRLVRSALDRGQADRLLEALRRALDFAVPREERHGIISNHLALFAVAMLDGAELLGDARYRARADGFIHRILAHQSAEGWYREYGGPDPGYETLALTHLSVFWQRSGDSRLLDSMRRSVAFLAHCVHPDGSLGGVYGSRHTSLYFPAGLEVLAPLSPEAAAVARFLRSRLDSHRVVTPAVAEPHNLVPLTYAYLEAHRAARGRPLQQPVALPWQALAGSRPFPEAGLVVAGTRRAWVVVGASRGGVCRVFDRDAGRAIGDDAGWLVREGRNRYASQVIGCGALVAGQPAGAIVCEARFARVRALPLTPVRLLALRILNLTVFRAATLAAWWRRRIVAALTPGRSLGPWILRREIMLTDESVTITDTLKRLSRRRATEAVRAGALTTTPAGSVGYWHGADGVVPPAADAAVLERLNREGTAVATRTIAAAPPAAGERSR